MIRSLIVFVAMALPLYAISAEPNKQRQTTTARSPHSQELPDKQPSLQETTDWLKEKFVAYGGGEMSPGNIPSSTKYEDIKFEGCSVSFVRTFVIGLPPGSKGEGGRFRSEISFSFSDIDPQSITQSTSNLGVSNISLKTKLNEPRIAISETSSISRDMKRESKDSVGFTLRDDEISKRMAKALAHMATLCYAKKESF